MATSYRRRGRASLKNISSTSVFSQIVVLNGTLASEITTYAEINPVAAQLTAGNGGNGSKGVGGAGRLNYRTYAGYLALRSGR